MLSKHKQGLERFVIMNNVTNKHKIYHHLVMGIRGNYLFIWFISAGRICADINGQLSKLMDSRMLCNRGVNNWTNKWSDSNERISKSNSPVGFHQLEVLGNINALTDIGANREHSCSKVHTYVFRATTAGNINIITIPSGSKSFSNVSPHINSHIGI